MKAQDQKELMRERICDCAKRLFEREGYEQVSMRQIAAEAGIAVGNLTYYFSKKEDLLKERLNDIQETFSESIQLFEIDLERGEISGKPFWEYENRTLLELLLRFLKTVEQFQKNAAVVYENLIYLIKLLTFFWQEMHGDQEYEKKRFTERICRLLIPYISWEWKDTYTVLCKEICEVSFHRMTLKFI
jgi:AcrR family transcriptional regulator